MPKPISPKAYNLMKQKLPEDFVKVWNEAIENTFRYGNVNSLIFSFWDISLAHSEYFEHHYSNGDAMDKIINEKYFNLENVKKVYEPYGWIITQVDKDIHFTPA